VKANCINAFRKRGYYFCLACNGIASAGVLLGRLTHALEPEIGGRIGSLSSRGYMDWVPRKIEKNLAMLTR
jgi:hypothetical protein